jgi:NAD(P)-dependent dehydrogenase (short-subunit alcohol dehydrogenase family)
MSGTAKLPKAAKLELLNRLASLHGAAPPDVIAEVVVFLASDEARFISGTEIRVDGAALA